MQGYFYQHPNAFSGMFIAPNEYANASKVVAMWDPILDKIASMPGISNSSIIRRPPVDFAASGTGSIQGSDGGAAANPGAGMQGMSGMRKRHGPGEKEPTPRGITDEDSRLLGEEELTHPKLAEALEKSMPDLPNAQLRSHVTAGGKVMTLGNDTSVNPAWRRAYVHLMVTGMGKGDASPLRAISPHGGAYINEASAKQTDWKNAFFGTHYPRLLSIKQKYDPNHLFYVAPGVGADLLVAKDGRLCKVGGNIKAVEDPTGAVPDSDNRNVGPHDPGMATWPMLYVGKGLPPKVNSGARMGGMPKMSGPPASANGTGAYSATPAGGVAATSAALGQPTPMAGMAGM